MACAAVAGGAGGAVTNLLFDGAAARHAHVRPAPRRSEAADVASPLTAVMQRLRSIRKHEP